MCALHLLSLREGECTVLSVKNIVVIILVAVAFGTLMAYGAGTPIAWQRAIAAALAFGALGWFIHYSVARRKR